eukprot:m.58506 g.58506  ORF g.58506 m.58506 type:complete len:353 (-) comp7826_c0_seq1:1016-2074(-)
MWCLGRTCMSSNSPPALACVHVRKDILHQLVGSLGDGGPNVTKSLRSRTRVPKPDRSFVIVHLRDKRCAGRVIDTVVEFSVDTVEIHPMLLHQFGQGHLEGLARRHTKAHLADIASSSKSVCVGVRVRDGTHFKPVIVQHHRQVGSVVGLVADMRGRCGGRDTGTGGAQGPLDGSHVQVGPNEHDTHAALGSGGCRVWRALVPSPPAVMEHPRLPYGIFGKINPSFDASNPAGEIGSEKILKRPQRKGAFRFKYHRVDVLIGNMATVSRHVSQLGRAECLVVKSRHVQFPLHCFVCHCPSTDCRGLFSHLEDRVERSRAKTALMYDHIRNGGGKVGRSTLHVVLFNQVALVE